MTDMLFLVFRTYFITLMTVGMMASMTEFRFKLGKLLGIMAVYSVWVIGSSIVILWVGGELLLLRLFSSPYPFLPPCLPTGQPLTPLPRRFSTT